MSIGQRIKDLRTEKKMTQTDLAVAVEISYIQIGRYETLKSKPSSGVLQKLAEVLGTSTDFLMNGSNDDKAVAQLSDKELLEQFRQVEQFNQEDKHLVKTFIDAFITKRKVQKLAG